MLRLCQLLVATTNRGKAQEFRKLLPTEIDVLTLTDLNLPAPEETGTSFVENARLKAIAAASASGMLAIADDSGLVVDALNGAPGIFSARYAGEAGDDAANRRKLLTALRGVDHPGRSARFVAAVAVASGDSIIAEAIGVVDGCVGFEERGQFGFGYDSLFVLPDRRTMAELPPEEKNATSHRARATRQLIPVLRDLFGLDIVDAEGQMS